MTKRQTVMITIQAVTGIPDWYTEEGVWLAAAIVSRPKDWRGLHGPSELLLRIHSMHHICSVWSGQSSILKLVFACVGPCRGLTATALDPCSLGVLAHMWMAICDLVLEGLHRYAEGHQRHMPAQCAASRPPGLQVDLLKLAAVGRCGETCRPVAFKPSSCTIRESQCVATHSWHQCCLAAAATG